MAGIPSRHLNEESIRKSNMRVCFDCARPSRLWLYLDSFYVSVSLCFYLNTFFAQYACVWCIIASAYCRD